MAGAEQLEDEEPRQQEVVHNHPDLGPRAGAGARRRGAAMELLRGQSTIDLCNSDGTVKLYNTVPYG